MEYSVFIILPILIMLCMFTMLISIFVWTYKDAKSRGLNAIVWTLIVMFVPNLMGLLLYFIVGRRESRIICSKCNSSAPFPAKYCNNCGSEIYKENVTEYKGGKTLLIVIITCVSIVVISLISLIVFAIVSNGGF